MKAFKLGDKFYVKQELLDFCNVKSTFPELKKVRSVFKNEYGTQYSEYDSVMEDMPLLDKYDMVRQSDAHKEVKDRCNWRLELAKSYIDDHKKNPPTEDE